VHSLDELRSYAEAERADLTAKPGPSDWDQYGGWAAGPKLEATGFFRVQKHEGKWWLVDPLGHLFWSQGIDCVGEDGSTPIEDREAWFRGLPAAGSPLAKYFGTSSALHGYYAGRTMRCFDFGAANVERKYGPDWRPVYADLAHKRLRSWGLNTIANWSSESIYRMDRTPYVATVHFGGKMLEGSQGYWGKFRDVFDPSFAEAVRSAMAGHRESTAKDPWCIGYFVDNEIAWGGDNVSLATAALTSPATQAAKVAFVTDLKAKYGTIDALNQAWGTSHASWDALLASTEAPVADKAGADLAAFHSKTCETYFHTIRDAVKEVAPNHLYLGCRFAWVNDSAAIAAAAYCDVVSYNLYRRSVADFKYPGPDVPLIIGEFHFGALDRGMFHTGLVATANQDARADTYRDYVRGALRHPQFVGCHWFKYSDEPTTGRPYDEENYQIGFVDAVDTPYPETIAAARDVGYGMYAYRASGGGR
jgi:hypothetical protein